MNSVKYNFPEIRIEYAWLLSDAASVGLNELWGDGTPLRSYDYYENTAKRYKKAWSKYEKDILGAMYDIFGLEFQQNYIDVHIAPWFRAFSKPMVIGVKYSDEEFVSVLTHEVLHRLFTDNKQQDYETNFVKLWRSVYKEKDISFNSLIHIPVHAGFEAIFRDYVKEPSRVDADIEKSKKYKDYDSAWNYVGECGYKNVIKEFKGTYAKK